MGERGGADQAERRERLSTALRQTASGDASALRQVYDMTSAKLFGICLRICGDTQAAEDVLQDVYVKVWRRAGAFDEVRASPISWLAAIARNAAVDWKRAHERHAPPTGDASLALIADDAPLADRLLEDDQFRLRLHACLDGLNTHEADAIRRTFLDGLTYQQLADRVESPLSTVKSWIRRGMMKLKGCLGDG
ncbi:sigma-70 family RNA polymerase sigma factor [Novosphingobium sp. Leaf2]|uniref:sigma-70 family RNA polymerase sigma factor n=1 Tax=Novosphingobium sp. Leaf2 TaxID=1735670 RepID=UPI0006F8CCAD|nr:sigma-70 family RNA polymerase sigma factor [Novosphingobium sp. Leaf2]KQM18267.1 RNA polymerase subunit sigma [Novosphingobium sp. Leaf2]